jgi:hypothetical protein
VLKHYWLAEESCSVDVVSAGEIICVVSLAVVSCGFSEVSEVDGLHAAAARTIMAIAKTDLILFFIDQLILKIYLHTGTSKRSPKENLLPWVTFLTIMY